MIFSINSVKAQCSLRLQIESLPHYHPVGADIYLSGSFNGWNPQDPNYKFHHLENGELTLDIKLNPGIYEYKVTRGSWDKVECRKDGSAIENRILKVDSDANHSITIEEWRDRFPELTKTSTAGKNVKVIDTSFLIPQLNRTRRVWIYLPESYSTRKKDYPVLYMQDGQNLFDEATAYAGEWGIDETLDTIGSNECIVVGIDHGGTKRLNEYNPYDNDRFGKGEGVQYVDFLVNTLKPFIDKNYRTKKKKDHTFIGGSSMGGLISLYAVLRYPKIFGAAGVFSPAFWMGPKVFEEIVDKGKKVKSRIYFYGGKLENENMVPDMLRAFDEMRKVSKSEMEVVIRDNGKHNEPTWRREFALFYEWLTKDF